MKNSPDVKLLAVKMSPQKRARLIHLVESLFKKWGREGYRLTGDRAQLQPVFIEPKMVFIASRGMGKSMLAAAKMLLYAKLYPGIRILYVVPEIEQRKTFNDQSIVPLILASDEIRAEFRNMEAVRHYTKRFNNGSLIWIEALPKDEDPGRLRGKHPDVLVVDECQDTHPLAVQRLIPGLDQSDLKWEQYYGTVKTKDRLSWVVWERSMQFDWGVKCEHCGYVNVPLGMANIGDKGPICAKCGKPLDVRRGKWIPARPSANIPGFRFNHLMAWWMQKDWQTILDRLETLDEPVFRNEVLGEPVEIGESPITERMLKAACQADVRNGQPPDLTVMRIAGIDWQGEKRQRSTTVAVIIEKRAAYWQVIAMKRFTGPEAEILRLPHSVIAWLNKFQPTFIFADWGGGAAPNAHLSRAYNHGDSQKFYVIQYSGGQKEFMKWNAEIGRFVANRQQAIQSVINAIAEKKIRFFKWDDLLEFKDDLMNVKYNENRVGYPVFEKAVYERTDDALHALVFAWLGVYAVVNFMGFGGPDVVAPASRF